MSVTATGDGASAKGRSISNDENADSPASVSSGRSSSDAAASPERSTPSAKGDKQQSYKKKQPLLLHRGKWQQQTRASLSRPAPGGLAAAAAAANARASAVGGGIVHDRRGSQAGLTGAADGGEGEATASTADAVTPEAAAAIGADRAAAAGARAMRGALEGLRSERDSLANACGRLEADREAASVQLREGGELVKRLTEARETLEADKRALAERCEALQGEVDAYARRKREEETAREAAESGLRARVVELEKNLEENAELVGCCRCAHAETPTDIISVLLYDNESITIRSREEPSAFFSCWWSFWRRGCVRSSVPLVFCFSCDLEGGVVACGWTGSCRSPITCVVGVIANRRPGTYSNANTHRRWPARRPSS